MWKPNALKSTIKTSVPFKVGQRNTSERLQGVMLQDLRIYGRMLVGDEVKAIGAKASRAR